MVGINAANIANFASNGLSGLDMAVIGLMAIVTAPLLFSSRRFKASPRSFEVREGPLAFKPQAFGPRRAPALLVVRAIAHSKRHQHWQLLGWFDEEEELGEEPWLPIQTFQKCERAHFALRVLHDAVFGAAQRAIESGGASAPSGLPTGVR